MDKTDIKFMKEHIRTIRSKCDLLEIMAKNLSKDLQSTSKPQVLQKE